ncbi:glycosyltransferase [Vibrio owensii]|uniref:Glycosyltransferase n=1 Tax=Vibrio owensii TaxID=696485 RepID=A0AAP9GGR9_9VIBR|nr:WecB/TagA/CpsF family glycosyltransferase [Vibrio owensii]AYO17483.1 glycosyltransferase [Vibrio owensii]QGH49625.1 WecB/TagA/CpsF family glycosyltransferase [Vibrio owensii]
MCKKINVLGVPAHSLTMSNTVNLIRNNLVNGLFTQHVVVNSAKLVHAQSDKQLLNSISNSDIINIDGMAVVWAARFLGYNVPERVAGVDLFDKLNAMAEKEGFPVFFLGAEEEVVRLTALRIQEKYSSIQVAGYHHGYFWDDEESLVRKIKSSGAKLLFVAITSPKKENFIDKWGSELGVDFVMGVGGTFDVIAGRVKRAPVWMQKSGLEWLYRIVQEPRRMWKRYATTNSKFIFLVMKEKISRLCF